MRESVGDSPTILAQVLHAAREEMAQTLADVVFRRTDLATGSYPGRAALRQCAEVLAREFSWDEARLEREIGMVAGRFPSWAVRNTDDPNMAVKS